MLFSKRNAMPDCGASDNTTRRPYILRIQCRDGCTAVLRGEKYEEGWGVYMPSGFTVTCPHGHRVVMSVTE